MRMNKFGEKYCESIAEVRRTLDDSPNGWDVYACDFSPPEDGFKATVEIRENGSGEVVCYLEAANVEQLRSMIAELVIEEG